MTDTNKVISDTMTSTNVVQDTNTDSSSTNKSEGKFYDGMPEDELEKLLLASIEDTTSPSALEPMSIESKLELELFDDTPAQNSVTKDKLADRPASVVDTNNQPDKIEPNANIKIDLETLRQQAFNKRKSTHQHTSERSAVPNDLDHSDPAHTSKPAPTPNPTSTIDSTEEQDDSSNSSSLGDNDDKVASVSDVALNAAPTSTITTEEFVEYTKLVEQTMNKIKKQLQFIANESAVLSELTTNLIAQMRHLQQLGEDDFSVTYEQIYQFRSCLFEAKRTFNEIPNFMDMVEHAWDNDIYTAQMRQKFLQEKS